MNALKEITFDNEIDMAVFEKNPQLQQAGSINNSWGNGFISSTNNFITFLGVKNCH